MLAKDLVLPVWSWELLYLPQAQVSLSPASQIFGGAILI